MSSMVRWRQVFQAGVGVRNSPVASSGGGACRQEAEVVQCRGGVAGRYRTR